MRGTLNPGTLNFSHAHYRLVTIGRMQGALCLAHYGRASCNVNGHRHPSVVLAFIPPLWDVLREQFSLFIRPLDKTRFRTRRHVAVAFQSG